MKSRLEKLPESVIKKQLEEYKTKLNTHRLENFESDANIGLQIFHRFMNTVYNDETSVSTS